MAGARRLTQVLSLGRATLGGHVPLPGLGRAFLRFGLGSLGFGRVLIRRRPRAFGLNRAASSLLAKLSGLLTTPLVTPTACETGNKGDKRQQYDNTDNNCNDCSSAHDSSLRLRSMTPELPPEGGR
jgi:hypothetical protein